MLMPNFLIVGAAKSGTTSLYYWLSQHPDVFFSEIKEPCFFCYGENGPTYKVNDDVVLSYDRYSKLFKNSENFKLRGEATAIYLYKYNVSISNIKKYINDYDQLKILMVLRNPIERAFSQYMMNVRDLRENLSFEEAIEAEQDRIKNGLNSDFFYVDRGFYYSQVRAYLQNFKNVKILLFEDLINDNRLALNDIFQFLDIDKNVVIDTEEKYNFSGRPRWRFLISVIRSDNFAKRIAKKLLPRQKRNYLFESIKNSIYKKSLIKEKMLQETRAKLVELYRDDIKRLSCLIGRDLTHWLR